MKKVRNMKRPLAAAVLSLTLLQFSAQSAVAVGTYTKASTHTTSQLQMAPVFGWAAIGAGVAVVGAAVGAVVGAYEVGTIVGHAAYDMFGAQSTVLSYDYERTNYLATDFSQFDNMALN
ncbi:hypothetical protein [Hymenobacter rubripertinctus]|uniref:DUF4134 domain-containing protein n=1 Tax=Hymenobacter rubripertinctus TaxID=2029981 RepID=A0A418R0R7_9BACT|nr:hypothetical protein [Hymenobacter rubripertinctus]RIY11026.1 hypothetical protein D0T11_08435 [Hymenobacter rubripertinctus]